MTAAWQYVGFERGVGEGCRPSISQCSIETAQWKPKVNSDSSVLILSCLENRREITDKQPMSTTKENEE